MKSRRWLWILALACVIAYGVPKLISWCVNNPIAFYGRVIDESERPVAGASVCVTVVRRAWWPQIPVLWASEYFPSEVITVETEADGMFVLQERGLSIAVTSVLTTDRDPQIFERSYRYEGTPFYSEHDHPIVFRIHNPR